MVRQLGLLALVAALLVGCGGPEGTEGETMNAAELKRVEESMTKDDGVPPPKPPADSPGQTPR